MKLFVRRTGGRIGLWGGLLAAALAAFAAGWLVPVRAPAGCKLSELTAAPDFSPFSPAAPVVAASDAGTPAAPSLPEKWVCLTFDDGPSKTTPDVLGCAGCRRGARHLFCGSYRLQREVSAPAHRRRSAAGHQIALHSASHEYSDIYRSSAAYWEDIALLKERIAPYVDAESIRYLRFPGGSTNTVSRRYGGKGLMKQLKTEVEQSGWQWVDWNVCAEDAVGGHPSADTIYRNVVRETGAADQLHRADARFCHHTHHRRSTAGHHPVVCRQRLHLFDRSRGAAAGVTRLTATFQSSVPAAPRQRPAPPARASLHRRSTSHPAARMAAKVHTGGSSDAQDAQQLLPPGRQSGVQLLRDARHRSRSRPGTCPGCGRLYTRCRPAKTPGTFPLWSG